MNRFRTYHCEICNRTDFTSTNELLTHIDSHPKPAPKIRMSENELRTFLEMARETETLSYPQELLAGKKVVPKYTIDEIIEKAKTDLA